MFNFYAYLSDILAENHRVREERWRLTTCSGLGGLEGALQNARTHARHVCLTDTTDTEIFRRAGGWYLREVYTLFLCSQYNARSGEHTYLQALGECRALQQEIISRLLYDDDQLRRNLLFLDLDTFRSRDLGQDFLTDTAGLYFQVAIDRPQDLRFNPEAWDVQQFTRTFDGYFL